MPQYGTITGTSSSWDATNKILTTTFTGYYAANIETKDQSIVYGIGYTDTSGAYYSIPVWNYIVPEKTAPTINTPVQSNVDTYNGWSTGKIFTFSGTENYCGTIKLTLKDSSGNIYLNNVSVSVSGGNWSYTCIPDIEANADGKNFTLTATDNLGNSRNKTFTVYKTDKKAPVLTSTKTTSTNWSKTKSYSVLSTDYGAGAVYIAFNNTSDYQLANVGVNYYRDYILTGDVYGSVKAAIYLKDMLGNTTTQFITVSNLDNTSPNITKVNKTFEPGKGTITITANDKHSTLGEGSGVTGYAMTTSTSAPTSWQTSNTFSLTENGTYYFWAKDAVGNTTYSKTNIVEIKYNVTTNHQIGGLISQSSNSLSYGDNLSVHIIPMSGYSIKDVTIDGTSKGAISTYDFWNVKTNHTVIATFTKTTTLTNYLNTLKSKYSWINF